MNKKILLISIIFFFMGQSSAYSKIDIVEWKDLADKNISIEGMVALSLDSDLWRHAETAHFVYHFVEEKQAETIYIHAELYYNWIKNFFDIKEDERPGKNHIFIFANRNMWDEFQKILGRPESSQSLTNGWELFMRHEPHWTYSEGGLAHEIAHITIFKFMEGPLPLFLNEGVAVFVSSCLMKEVLGQKGYRPALIPYLGESEYIPLKEISAMASYPEGRTNIFYREGDWFIRFLVTTYGNRQCYEFLLAVSRDGDFKGAMEKAYGIDFSAIEEQFKKYSVSGK